MKYTKVQFWSDFINKSLQIYCNIIFLFFFFFFFFFFYYNFVDWNGYAKTPRKCTAFPSCVGGFQEADRCPAGIRSMGRPRRRIRRLPTTPANRTRLEWKSTASLTEPSSKNSHKTFGY